MYPLLLADITVAASYYAKVGINQLPFIYSMGPAAKPDYPQSSGHGRDGGA